MMKQKQTFKSISKWRSKFKYKVYLNRVRNYFLAERYNEAVQAGEQYLSKITPDKEKAIYSEMLDKIGLSYFRLGKYDQARSYYSKIASMKGYEVYGKFQIADSYYNEKIMKKQQVYIKKFIITMVKLSMESKHIISI